MSLVAVLFSSCASPIRVPFRRSRVVANLKLVGAGMERKGDKQLGTWEQLKIILDWNAGIFSSE